jgi:hypothetical protein|eukprot:SAG25_NODE_23_length_22180_cov_132.152892_8_plen_81_part_00
MITLQRSNPTVTQILAAHGCQTTALQDRYDIHTACSSSCSSFAFPLGLLRLSHIAQIMIIIQILVFVVVVMCLCACAGGD